jgi:hypothetical protein
MSLSSIRGSHAGLRPVGGLEELLAERNHRKRVVPLKRQELS